MFGYILDKKDRSLKNIATAFGLKEYGKRPSLALRMNKWLEDDKGYSQFFNNKTDNMDFDSQIVAFDMSSILEDDDLLSPTAFYLFHKFDQVILKNPSPHFLFIDEMSNYINSKRFAPRIIETLQRSRKKEGVFIGCIQEPSTVTDNPHRDEIMSNLATLILFPNAKADKREYIEGLKLTDNEFNFIKECSNPRKVMIKKENSGSVVIDVNMYNLGKYLKFFSSSDTNLSLFKKLTGTKNWRRRYLNG